MSQSLHETHKTQLASNSIFWVEVDKISPNPYQPRREFDKEALEALSESIRQYGVLQPLVVTRREVPKHDGGISVEYELIAGERRLRASKLAGVGQVPVVIRTGEDNNLMKLELAIIENLQREDLNPVDRARAFHQFIKEFGYKHSEIAKKVGKSREYVSNSLRLLALPDEILDALIAGKITEGHARPIMMLRDKPEEQLTLFKEVMHKKLTVRDAESIARRCAQDKIRKKNRDFNPEILKMEKELTEQLGTRVQIESREVGGKIVIDFFSEEDLKNILELMNTVDAEVLSKTFSHTGSDSAGGDIEEENVEKEDGFSKDTTDEKLRTESQPEVVQEQNEDKEESREQQDQTDQTGVLSQDNDMAAHTDEIKTTSFNEHNEVDKKNDKQKDKEDDEFELPDTGRFREEVNSILSDPNKTSDENDKLIQEAGTDQNTDSFTQSLKSGGDTNTVPQTEEEDDDDIYSVKNFSV